MANLRYRLWGPSGSRKTCTALTGRGRQAVIDRDNQMFIYWKNPRFADIFSPLARMVEPFDGPGPDGRPLAVGDPAVWMAMDASTTTKERVKEFTAKAGLGKGDQLVDDPFSALWEMSLDASDVKFGQKGMKVDFYGLKRPTTSLMNLYKAVPYDVAFTAHQKAEWDKAANAPSNVVGPTGEGQRTPRDIMFEFRMESDGPHAKMFVTKEKGMLFKVGEVFTDPILREVFAARGLYEFVDNLAEEAPVEMDESLANSLLAGESRPVSGLSAFLTSMRDAAAAGRLADFRADPANMKRAAGLSPADLDLVRTEAARLAQ